MKNAHDHFNYITPIKIKINKNIQMSDSENEYTEVGGDDVPRGKRNNTM